MNCWPSAWVEAAKQANLAHRISSAPDALYFCCPTDGIFTREALEKFAIAIAAAERQRIKDIVVAQMPPLEFFDVQRAAAQTCRKIVQEIDKT